AYSPLAHLARPQAHDDTAIARSVRARLHPVKGRCLRLLKLRRRTSVPSVTASCRPGSCRTSKSCESLTLLCASKRTARTAARCPETETTRRRPYRHHGGPGCTRTRRQRKTALMTPSARFVWKSLRWAWQWPVWSVSVASTEHA